MTAPAFWDGIAASYSAKPVEDPDAFERKIAHTRGLLTTDAVFLDVGCGTGTLALTLAPHVRASHGLDFSPAMVQIARQKAADEGVENATFHVGAIADIDLEPGSVDVLGANSLLHLLPDRPAFLKRAFDLIRPGGHLVSSTVCLGDSWAPYGLLIGAMRMVGKAPYVDIVPKARILEEIRAAGFVDVTEVDVGALDRKILFATARRPGSGAG
jgi:2-polyprenyl-3-methyl-5-hydroxy-6-metoxy-1,4-benzoquinol methylase